jgi:hypothetical protein
LPKKNVPLSDVFTKQKCSLQRWNGDGKKVEKVLSKTKEKRKMNPRCVCARVCVCATNALHTDSRRWKTDDIFRRPLVCILGRKVGNLIISFSFGYVVSPLIICLATLIKISLNLIKGVLLLLLFFGERNGRAGYLTELPFCKCEVVLENRRLNCMIEKEAKKKMKYRL